MESTQTHVHCVSDAIQPSHPLSSPSPPALNLSQHQSHFPKVELDGKSGRSNYKPVSLFITVLPLKELHNVSKIHQDLI